MILERIVAQKQTEIEDLRRGSQGWKPPAAPPRRRGFRAALEGEGISVIAEFKRRSPSRGELRAGADPGETAGWYERGGAAALSVLTDEQFFGGTLEDLRQARAAARLPVLRKDFIVDRCQIAESAGPEGPDCLLLIAAALETKALRELRELAAACGQETLVEVHDEVEAAAALESGATLIGINNRDLRTFQVSLETTLRLRAAIPAGVLVVSESGIRDGEDVRRLADAGVDAVLVGEALMTASDPAQKIRDLLGAA